MHAGTEPEGDRAARSASATSPPEPQASVAAVPSAHELLAYACAEGSEQAIPDRARRSCGFGRAARQSCTAEWSVYAGTTYRVPQATYIVQRATHRRAAAWAYIPRGNSDLQRAPKLRLALVYLRQALRIVAVALRQQLRIRSDQNEYARSINVAVVRCLMQRRKSRPEQFRLSLRSRAEQEQEASGGAVANAQMSS